MSSLLSLHTFSFLLILALSLLLSPVAAGAIVDTTGPTISEVAPLSAVYTVPQLYYATASDASGISSCTLLVSSVYETPMTYNSFLGRWQVNYTFTTYRSANSIRMVCEDIYGNETKGPSRIISVAAAPTTDPEGSPDEVDATDWTSAELVAASPVLIKTACPGGEDFTHPCRTVYFLGDFQVGGPYAERHAFPNEKAYFTWYTDWSNIHIITEAMMASYSLGANVTYHPGVRMVKFPSFNTVYAVARYGEMRAIGSEAIATELYGSNWNQMVDDVSEAFYTNYMFGHAIAAAVDFDVDAETNSVLSINDNYLRLE